MGRPKKQKLPLRTFEEICPIIDELLEKKRSKWQLEAISSYDYDDAKQDIKLHVFHKFYQWDQSRPIEPWLNRVIQHKIFNKKRDLWGNKARPCNNCVYNVGTDSCLHTKSKLQCGECPLYAKWEKSKKNAYEIAVAKNLEDHIGDVKTHIKMHEEIDHERFLRDLEPIMKEKIDDDNSKINLVIYKTFVWIYIEKRSEEYIANKLGYKTTEDKRSPGYKQISNHRATIKRFAKEILDQEDWRFISNATL